MPDPSPAAGATVQPPPIGTAELADGAAAAVLAVPGVARLEPTLRNALRRLQTSTDQRRPARAAGAGEGVSLRRRHAVIDLHVDLAVTPTRPAHLTAAAVQRALQRYLTTQQLSPGTITVAVLTLER